MNEERLVFSAPGRLGVVLAFALLRYVRIEGVYRRSSTHVYANGVTLSFLSLSGFPTNHAVGLLW
jgi:hypothetical protein